MVLAIESRVIVHRWQVLMATDLNDFGVIYIIVDHPLHHESPGPVIGHFLFSDACCRIHVLHDFAKLVDSNGCVEEPSLKKEAQENASKWKGFWITNTKFPQIRRTPAFFSHKILISFSNISRLPYTTLKPLNIHFNKSFFYKHSMYPLWWSLLSNSSF